MGITKIKTKMGIFIGGCKERLAFDDIKKIAEEYDLKDFRIEENKRISTISGEIIGYRYILKFDEE